MRTNDVVELVGLSLFSGAIIIAVCYGTGLLPLWATMAVVMAVSGVLCAGVANRGGE